MPCTLYPSFCLILLTPPHRCATTPNATRNIYRTKQYTPVLCNAAQPGHKTEILCNTKSQHASAERRTTGRHPSSVSPVHRRSQDEIFGVTPMRPHPSTLQLRSGSKVHHLRLHFPDSPESPHRLAAHGTDLNSKIFRAEVGSSQPPRRNWYFPYCKFYIFPGVTSGTATAPG
jgi:hypothetical protein